VSPLWIAKVVALGVAWIAAVSDVRTETIPNWLTLPTLVVAPLAWGLALGPLATAEAVTGAFLCGLVPYLLFRVSGGGGGDVKLFAALGAVVGPGHGLEIELLGFLVAALYALGRLAWDGRLLVTLGNTFYLSLNPVLPVRYRRQVSPELMSKVRLGLPVALAVTLLAARDYLLLRVG